MARLAKLVLGLLALGLLCLAVARAEAAAQAEVIRRIVVFSAQTPPGDRVTIAETSGGKVVRDLRLIDAVVIEVPSGQVHAAEARLKSRPEVVRVDEDPRLNWLLEAAPRFMEAWLPDVRGVIKPFKAHSAADEPPTQQPPAQELPWGIKRVNAPEAWKAAAGQGVKVAVIDTGIDYDHPDLKANIAGGWNATSKEKPNDFKDDHGHGTHVSGTIAALDDSQGVVGVAPKATVYGVKVLDANGSGTFDDVIAGMQWAVENKMQVASMSLGAYRGNDSLKAAVEAMAKAGVALVAAAGNSGGSVAFPAAYPGAIAIAASDSADKVAYFSSRGPQVALIAPGVDVKSTTLGGTYGTMSGTSMATPHVSGLAALAISAKGLKGGEAVRAELKKAATPLKDAPAEQQGAGLVDAAMLVK